MRNNMDNDTLKLEFISNNFSLPPSYRFKFKGGIYHSISISFSKNSFKDKNLFVSEFGSNNATSLNSNYSMVFGKMNIGASFMMMSNKRQNGKLQIFSGNIRIAKKMTGIETLVNHRQEVAFVSLSPCPHSLLNSLAAISNSANSSGSSAWSPNPP